MQKSAKKYGKNKNSVYWIKREGVRWNAGRKKKKSKKAKTKKRKEVGNRKVVAGAEGALTEGCRKRKVEICSVRKDGGGGSLLTG